MATPQVSTRFFGDVLSYGLGLEQQSVLVVQPDPEGEAQFYAAPEIYHTGMLPGFRSIVLCIPSIDFCFIALANYDDANFYAMELAALRLATLPEPVAPPEVAPVPGRFPEYVGSYLDPFALGLLTVSSDGHGSLQLDWPLLDQLGVPYGHALTPTYVDNFTVEIAGDLWPVTFLAGPGGGFDYLRTLDRSVATRWELVGVASVSGALTAPVAPVRLRDALERRDF
jgi:hypothetical protein